MSLWQVVKWVALVVLALGLTVALARIFSGSEDAWVRAADGTWVAHGHPAGPPPSADYRPPWPERVLPWFLLVAFAGGVLAAMFLSARAPANREGIDRSVRFLGAVSIITAVLAGCLSLALLASLATGLGAVFDDPFAVVLVLLGLAAFLGLIAAQAHGTKKVLEAHYDLKRTAALLQDAVERLGESHAGTAGRGASQKSPGGESGGARRPAI